MRQIIKMRKGIFLLIFWIAGRLSILMAAQVTVPSDVAVDTMRLYPQAAAPAGEEGRMYYDSSDHKFKFHDGSGYKALGGGADSKAGAKIMAAYNSVGSQMPAGGACTPSNGSGCTNPKADITCDGVNDGATIRAVLNSMTQGATLYLLEGTYNFSGTLSLQMADSNKSIIGNGPGTILRFASGSPKISLSNTSGISVSQLTIDANDADIDAISLSNSHSCTFDKISVKNKGGIKLVNSSYNRLSQITIDRGIIKLDTSSQNLITRSYIVGRGTGTQDNGILLVDACDYNTISHNYLYQQEDRGIYITSYDPETATHGQGCKYNAIFSNTVVGAGAGCIDEGSIVLRGSSLNRVAYNKMTAGAAAGLFLYSDGSGYPACELNTVIANRIDNCARAGIYLHSAVNNTISDNLLMDNGLGDTTCSNDDSEINVRASSSGNSFNCNSIYNNNPSDISEMIFTTDSSPDNYLAGNYFYVKEPCGNVVDMPENSAAVIWTDQKKLTFEPGSYTISSNTLIPGTTSHLQLSPASNIILSSSAAIAAGQSSGDILVVENISNTYTVTVPNSTTTTLPAGRVLGQYDSLILIWDSVLGKWAEISYSNN